MIFLRNIFSKQQVKPAPEETWIEEIYTKEYVDNNWTREQIKPELLEGCLRFIENYFRDNNIERKVESPVNHPINLDGAARDGLAFIRYCRIFHIGEMQATLFLAYAFSAYLIGEFGLEQGKDASPANPLRGMTLKYDRKNGMVVSLYPFEYAAKVLHSDRTFTEMEEKLHIRLRGCRISNAESLGNGEKK